jgi:hypothetical protein
MIFNSFGQNPVDRGPRNLAHGRRSLSKRKDAF